MGGGCKKVESGGCFFNKKVDLSSTQGALCTVSVFFNFTFYLFGGAPNATPAYRSALMLHGSIYYPLVQLIPSIYHSL